MTPMQKIIETILANHNLLGAFNDPECHELHLKLENKPYMPLVIEKVGADTISVCHFFIQEGDVMYDPELTFGWLDWVPTSITQHPLGRYAEVFRAVGDNPRALCDSQLLRELKSFATMWATNIKDQGFTGDNVKAKSLSHSQVTGKPNVEDDYVEPAIPFSLPDDADIQPVYDQVDTGWGID